MIFAVFRDEDGRGRVVWPGHEVRAAIGRGGFLPAGEKREGDGAGPIGAWPIRRVLYRPDKLGPPKTGLPTQAIRRTTAGATPPLDEAYNHPVTLPYPASAERMWRDDHVYDLVVVLGHNDDPTVPDAGSAIFLHLARPDYSPTEGCVALARPDLEALLAAAKPGDLLEIRD
ncbi:MAG: L,D-transpeptidase family protein [Caulobacteraceae bacterium]